MSTDELVRHLLQEDQPDLKRVSRWLMVEPASTQEMSTSKYIEFFYIINGSMELVVEEDRFSAGPGDILMIPSQTPHRYGFDPEEGLQVCFIGFSWKPESVYFDRISNRKLSRLPPLSKARIAQTVEQIQAELPRSGLIDEAIMQSHLMVTLLTILREVNRTQSKGKSVQPNEESNDYRRSILLQAKAYLNKHYHEAISLEDVAQALHISVYRLSHIFSEESDFTLFSYLTHLRMKRAITLLRGGELNVSEVAAAVGYTDSNYFSKAFKRCVGQSPSYFLRKA